MFFQILWRQRVKLRVGYNSENTLFQLSICTKQISMKMHKVHKGLDIYLSTADFQALGTANI